MQKLCCISLMDIAVGRIRNETIRTQSTQVEYNSIRVVYIRLVLWIHLKSEIFAIVLRINVKVGCEVTKGLRP